jgi:hypothetical protein
VRVAAAIIVPLLPVPGQGEGEGEGGDCSTTIGVKLSEERMSLGKSREEDKEMLM